jgi:hypothetical protein
MIDRVIKFKKFKVGKSVYEFIYDRCTFRVQRNKKGGWDVFFLSLSGFVKMLELERIRDAEHYLTAIL